MAAADSDTAPAFPSPPPPRASLGGEHRPASTRWPLAARLARVAPLLGASLEPWLARAAVAPGGVAATAKHRDSLFRYAYKVSWALLGRACMRSHVLYPYKAR